MKTPAVLVSLCALALIQKDGPTDLATPAHACAPVWRSGTQGVDVADESAIILWNSATKVQHFIRRATFKTDTPDFGFLVPTPTQPTLSEAKDEAFSYLEKLTLPEIVRQKRYEFDMPFGFGCGSKDTAKSAGVQVLEESRVGGFDYAVLAADKASDLSDWLTKNKYVSRADLTAWLEIYVKNGWKITAFKIAKDAKGTQIATSAVCMSFSTETPFFPYSEPADQRQSASEHFMPRLLRVFFLSDRRYEGRLEGTLNWPGKTIWADALPADQLAYVGILLAPGFDQKQHGWLTMIEDSSSPRPGTTDVSFAPSPQQDVVHRPPVIIIEKVNVAGYVCSACFGLMVLFTLTVPLYFLLRKKGKQPT